MPAVCQNCYEETERRCSVCGVCLYCSERCELVAGVQQNARAACSVHLLLKLEETNLGKAGAHLRMYPMYTVDVNRSTPVHDVWAALKCGVAHFARTLIADSPSKVYKKSAFGALSVLNEDFKVLGGGQRIRFESTGKIRGAPAAAKHVIAGLANLALANTTLPFVRAVIAAGP